MKSSADLGVDRIFASPLGRVRETLGLFVPHVNLTPVFDDRLMEWSAGDWSGRLYREIRQETPDDYAAWQADLYNVRSPWGENFADLDARAAAFFDEAGRVAHERIAIVGHGFMNRALPGDCSGCHPTKRSRSARQRHDFPRSTRTKARRPPITSLAATAHFPGSQMAGHATNARHRRRKAEVA